MTHYHVLIIGDGDAGISTAEQLLRKKYGFQIAVIDPEGANLKGTPHNFRWIKEVAAFFQPFRNKLITDHGNQFSYDYLIIQSLSHRSLSLIRQSLLVDKKGSIDIYKNTFQHKKYHNIFALTDTVNTSNDENQATTKKRVPLLIKNLISLTNQDASTGQDNSIDNISIILPEFKYCDSMMKILSQRNKESIESMSLWKKQNLPWFYYHKRHKGLA